MIPFENVSEPLTPADIDNVERRFGFKFPNVFRDHYLKQNGGRPKSGRLVGSNGTFTIDDFFPMKTSAIATLATLEKTLQWLKVDQAIMPEHLFPFAGDPFGNLYCFSVRAKDYGSIYWLKMDGRREPDGKLVASSLRELLAKLDESERSQKPPC